MKIVKQVEDAINKKNIPPGSVIYAAGNAATPQNLLSQLGHDLDIKEVDLYSLLLLGDQTDHLFSKERCKTLTHRVIFSGHMARKAINKGWAKYHPMHLSEIPAHTSNRVSVVMLTVSGPDNGGNYSLGTTVEAVLATVRAAKRHGGIVIAELNARMPFVLGSTIPGHWIDYLIETDTALPVSPVRETDESARRIGEIIAAMYIQDGRGDRPGSTLQYGIGEVPEAVTDAIINRGYGDLGIHTELFAGAMRRLSESGAITNRWKKDIDFSVSSIFLAENQEGYDWLHFNSSIQSRGCTYTNRVGRISQQPQMVSINSAMGVDLAGNIWADSLEARSIYSGVGGQADFIRGVQYSEGGVAIIALKSMTSKGQSKIVDYCPAGITTTATPADNVIIVTENGAFDPRGLSLGERATGIAHLATPENTEKLLEAVHNDSAIYKSDATLANNIPGFTPYAQAITHHGVV